LNSAAPPHLIDDEQTPDCANVTFHGGKVRGDTGYVEVGNATVLRGTPKGVFQHQDASANTEIILVTDDTFYKYVSTVGEWHYVSDGVSTTLDDPAGEPSGETLIAVAATAGLAVTDHVGITQDDLTQHQTTIAAINPGVSITIDDALTDDAALGSAVVKAADLSGSDLYQVVFVAVPSNEWTVFTNGVDYPMRYDGSTVEVIPNLPNAGDTVCRTVALYKAGYLLLGNLVDGGVDRPYKIYWCDAGDPTNWSTGDAGYVSLVDARDTIEAIKPLGDYVIVYRSRSIVRGEFLGMPHATFFWRTTVHGQNITAQGAGAVSPNAVFMLPDKHVFGGRAGIFAYDGGFQVQEISRPVYESHFSSRGEMDASENRKFFMSYVDKEGDIYYYYSRKDDSFPKQALILNVNDGTWRVREYLQEITSAADKLRGAGEEPQIQDLEGTISAQSWIIGGSSVLGDSPAILLCGTAGNGGVYEYDFVATTEAGLGFGFILWDITTKRWRSLDRYFRHAWLDVEYSGGPIIVTRIGEIGPPATIIKTLPAVGIATHVRIYNEFVDKSIQYRFAGTKAPGIEIGSLSIKYKEVGMHEL
jgi:hypothetical protein